MMKKISCGILLIVLFFVGQVHADERTDKFLVLASFAAVDFRQSTGWVTPGGGADELNPILGNHPTRAGMLTFGVAGILATWFATSGKPTKWKTIFLDSVLETEKFTIEENSTVQKGYRPRINTMAVFIVVRF